MFGVAHNRFLSEVLELWFTWNSITLWGSSSILLPLKVCF